jgi:anhydro-N-acetylmuramic acid kinase
MAGFHVGLISGTSMDGIDAVVVDFSQRPPRLLAAHTQDFDAPIRNLLDRLRLDPDHFPLNELGCLDAMLGDALANAALQTIEMAGLEPGTIAAIGSHGQTVLHRVHSQPAHTLQIGDPARIAEKTGITTVADFRRADVAAGGQGAPLAPLIHQAVLSSPDESRVVVNLGGIANLTHLAAGQPLIGFDTGPANCFLDLWYRRHRRERFDVAGAWAAGGRIDADWVGQLLQDPYFRLEPPKSTGIEYFSAQWLEQRLPHWANARPQDIQASLAEFSAISLAEAIRPFEPDRVLLCGGGVHNTDLCRRIGALLPDYPIEATDAHGLPADQVEATLFAWLAAERLAGRRIPTASITGAQHPVLLGAVFGGHA